MAIAFVNKSDNATSGGTSLAINKPTNTAEGHLMLAVICIENAYYSTINSVPTGWTPIILSSIGTRTHCQCIYYKVAGGSEPSSYTWGTSSSVEMAGGIATWSGVNSAKPLGNAQLSSANASSVNAVAPSILASVNNAIVVVASNMYGTTWTAPTGSPTFAEIIDRYSTTGTNGLSVHMSWATVATTDLTGTKTAVAANADYWKASIIELIDASYGEPIPDFTPVIPPFKPMRVRGNFLGQSLSLATLFNVGGHPSTISDVSWPDINMTAVGGNIPCEKGFAELDGVDDCFDLPAEVSGGERNIFYTRTRGTLNFVFRLNSVRADAFNLAIFTYCISTGTSNNVRFFITPSLSLRASFANTSSNTIQVFTDCVIKLGKWYSVVFTQDGNGVRVFVNGVKVGTGILTAGTATSAWWFSNTVSGTMYPCVGGWRNSVYTDQANLDYALISHHLDGGLNDEAAAELSRNPFKIFESQPPAYMYLPMASVSYKDFLASVQGRSDLTTAGLDVLRAIAPSMIGASSTPTAALNILRAISGGVIGQSSVPTAGADITRQIASNSVGNSSVPTAAANVLRALTAASYGNSSVPTAAGNILRSLTAASVGNSYLGTADLVTANLINFIASITGVSSVPAATVAVIKGLVASVVGKSETPTAAANITRNLIAGVIGNSSVPTAAANITRGLTAAAIGNSSVPTAAADVLRLLTAGAIGNSSLPNINLSLANIVNFVASITGKSQTEYVSLTVLRLLAAGAIGNSSIPNIILTVPAIINLIANIVGRSSVPTGALNVLRQLNATARGQSDLGTATLGVLRLLIANARGTTDVQGTLVKVIGLAANIVGQSVTSQAAATIARALMASATGNSDATADLGVLRDLIASAQGRSLLEAIDLVLGGLATLLSPIILDATAGVDVADTGYGFGAADTGYGFDILDVTPEMNL